MLVMKRSFFARYALLVVCIVLFFAPFALRGARMSMQRMTNRVKDWLPSDFLETAELEWFGRHFMGEQFVVVTWPGCSVDDPRYHRLVDRISQQVAPPEQHEDATATVPRAVPARKPFEQLTADERLAADRQRAGELADQLGLTPVGDYFENWGKRGEKWLQGDQDLWYFITPRGELYRWSGRSNTLNWLFRTFRAKVLGQIEADGDLIATFGLPPTPDHPNAFHANPELISARLFKSLTTGPDTLAQLSRKDGPLWPLGVDDAHAAEEARRKAMERLTGALFAEDGKQTCLILTFSEAGKRDLRRVIGREVMGRPQGRLRYLATVECGISAEDLKLGGPPVDNVAIDEEGQITLARLIVLSAIVGIGLSLFLVRSVRVTLILFSIGGLAAANSLAMVWWTGGTVDAIMMSMPSLVYVLAISGALHLTNYYRNTVYAGGLADAPGTMVRLGSKAALMCAGTTAMGLASLSTSNLSPIRNFGIYGAIGVMATLGLLFTLLPSALQLWPPRMHNAARPKERIQPSAFELGVERLFERIGAFIVRRAVWVSLVFALVFGGCALGVFAIHTNVHLIKFFDRKAEIIQDYTWLERHLTKLVPMELVVRVRPEMIRSDVAANTPSDASHSTSTEDADAEAEALRRQRLQLNFLERLEIAARIQNAVDQHLGAGGQNVVGRALSVPTFAPDLPPPGYPTLRDPVRSVMNHKLAEHRAEYLATDYLRIDRGTNPPASGPQPTAGPRRDPNVGSELWRISLRVDALRDIDYGLFVGELKRVVEPVLSAYHFRERVLDELDAYSGDRGFLKSRVAFLGASDPAESQPASPRPAPAADLDSATARDDSLDPADLRDVPVASSDSIDQTQLFSQTLKDLMTCAGVYAKSGCWHNPDKISTEPGFYTSETWGAVLNKKFDCVVLVSDNPAYDVDFIRQHARIFVDARQHDFDPSSPQAETAAQRGDPIQVVYTGVVPLVYKAQRSLLESLITSTFWAFVTITPFMIWLMRSIPAGLLMMLPNVLPVVAIFGTMGLLGINVDVGSMMTASVALGIAVDDTIHYLTWFRHSYQEHGCRKQAIMDAYRHCALPTVQAASINGLGLSVFALSTFTPTQRFGYLMLCILYAGMIAQLIMTPALLAGPLGSLFKRPTPRRVRTPRTTAALPVDAEAATGAAAPSGGFPQPHLAPSGRLGRPGVTWRRDPRHDKRDG